MIAAFWVDVAPVVYLVTVVLVLLGALGFALALCRMGAINEEPLRPRGGVSSVEPIDGADFPGLTAWGDELRERTEASR